MAIFSAVSTDSEPELVKKTLFMPGGAISTSRSASSKAFGWAIWNGGAKSSSAACCWMACTIFGRAWPAFTHHRPATPSRICAALGRPVVHARGPGQQARRLLELPVGGEGHPVGVHVRWPWSCSVAAAAAAVASRWLCKRLAVRSLGTRERAMGLRNRRGLTRSLRNIMRIERMQYGSKCEIRAASVQLDAIDRADPDRAAGAMAGSPTSSWRSGCTCRRRPACGASSSSRKPA